MKQLGAEWVIGVAAVGSLREEIAPGHLVVPDQLIDRTFQRPSTFFGNGIVAHVSFADPFCPVLGAALDGGGAARRRHGARRAAPTSAWRGRSSRRGPSPMLYRQWGADVIGMTNLQEAKLAREAELCFATLALATDYDCWHERHADVVIGDVLAHAAGQRRHGAAGGRRDLARPCRRARTCACATRSSTPSSPTGRGSRQRSNGICSCSSGSTYDATAVRWRRSGPARGERARYV